MNADERRLTHDAQAQGLPSLGFDGSVDVEWFARIAGSAPLRELINHARAGGPCAARGIAGSSAAITAAAIAQESDHPVLLVVAHLDEADEALDELESLGFDAEKLPAIEYAAGESGVNVELLAERLALVHRLMNGETPQIIIAPIQSLMQHVPRPETMASILRVVEPGTTLDAGEFAEWLHHAAYRRVEAIENPGEYAVRGGIIDIYPPGGMPARIDLFGDEVDGLFEIDLATMGSDRKLDRIEVIGAVDEAVQQSGDGEPLHLADVLPREIISVLIEMLELTEQARGYFERVSDPVGIFAPSDVFQKLAKASRATVEINHLSSASVDDRCIALPVEPLPTFAEDASEAVKELAEVSQQHETYVHCQNEGEAARMKELLAEFAPRAHVNVEERYLHRGFVWREHGGRKGGGRETASGRPEQGDDLWRSLALVPYHELMHRYHTRRRVRKIAGGRAMDTFLDLQPGDYVVHRDHGIAKFTGLRTLEDKRETASAGVAAPEEYLTLEFSKGAKLHVPVSKIDLVQKYIGAFTGKPELSTLGGKKWKKQKEQVREAVRDYAAEMLRLQAARETLPGIRYPADTTWQKEFEAEFPYEETEDQLATIAAVKRDMSDPKPMDRLVCGDVGFGKTEIAMRAAFKAAEYGKQVAVLVPTTVLAEQHDRTFHDRFADYPFRIESISRFKTKKDQTKLLKELREGKIDIIIGTHRLLSKDVKFADLGLVIVDEEQRFGVEHKQQLLQFRTTADVLTLSATPIPRTLHMAMLGLRDISSLTTAPLDRRAIVTEVLTYDAQRIRQAIERELAREGQVFFVHNRVHNIQSMADEVQKLAPDARIVIGHGQMPIRQLERVMLQFIRGQHDILVCTTIIESGIDLPRVNTMVIHDADMFGLAELHQLRGRVGRYKHRAYCYMTVSADKVLSEVALKRLRAIESFSMLGAGFKIALRDLEIRGAGSLLGHEQSGHIAAVGYEMYCQLLEQEVAALKQQRVDRSIDVTLDLGITGSLPKGYIPSDMRRMDAYRRISIANKYEDLEKVRHDIESAYGELPRLGSILIELAELRISAMKLDIISIRRHERDVIFRTKRPDLLESRMGGAKGTLRLVGQPNEDGVAEVYYRPPPRYFEDLSLLHVLRTRLRASDQHPKPGQTSAEKAAIAPRS